LEKLIDGRPVTCYSDADDPIDAKKLKRADTFVGETNLQVEWSGTAGPWRTTPGWPFGR
jgi:hypothetical protein